MNTKYTYPAVFKKDETGYFVSCPDIMPYYTDAGFSLSLKPDFTFVVLATVRYTMCKNSGETAGAGYDINSLDALSL